MSLVLCTLSSFISRLPDVIDGISEAKEEVGQHVNDVGLEKPSEHVAKHLKGEQCTFAVIGVLLVRDCVGQLLHDVQLLQGKNAEAFNDAGNA